MGISIGIVGIGAFGGVFAPLFRDHPRVDRIALCDVDSSRLHHSAQTLQISETYCGLDEICRSDLDALAIFTQPWLHAPQVIQALQSGKHVYSAVPIMMLSDGDEMLAWCDRVVEACKRTGLHYMMGETSYYRSSAMYCRRCAAKGAFGGYVLAEGEYFHDIDDPGCSLRDVIRERWGMRFDASKTGGIPMHYSTHSLGGFLSVMPEARITAVSAVGHVLAGDDWFRMDTDTKNEFGNETAFCRLSNGAVARICEYRRIGHESKETFSLFGTEGSFLETPAGCYWVTKQGKTALTVPQMQDPLPDDVLEAYRRTDTPELNIFEHHGGSHPYLVDEFVNAVDQDRIPAINAWVAARIFAPGIVAHQSAMKDGQWLPVPDWGDPQ